VGWGLWICFWFAAQFAVSSRAMWISAWTGRPGYAAVQVAKGHLWVLFWLQFMWRGPFRFQRGNEGFLGFMGLFLLISILGTFQKRALLREKLTRELRDIASAPIPARGDKRFKGWNPERIFPPGRWGYLNLDLRPAKIPQGEIRR
jgi:hypothetical protein